MTSLEKQVAALLTAAPGEPPTTIDPDAVVARAHPRPRRYLAPALAAAVVVAIAVPVAVHLAARDTTAPPAKPSHLPGGPRTPGPHGAASRRAEQILRSAAVLPHARRVASPPSAALDRAPSECASQTLVQRTAFWTAPGSVGSALHYLKSRPPAGFTVTGYGGPDGAGDPTPRSLYLSGDGTCTSLQYAVAAVTGGVAVRADAQVAWSPRRSPADTVPASVTSVDVLVVRSGAQAVHRTLSGAAMTHLAGVVNGLPRPAGECIGGIGVPGHDRLVFHSPHETVRVSVDTGTTCAFVRFQAGRRSPIELWGRLDPVVLRALGLAADYGR